MSALVILTLLIHLIQYYSYTPYQRPLCVKTIYVTVLKRNEYDFCQIKDTDQTQYTDGKPVKQF